MECFTRLLSTQEKKAKKKAIPTSVWLDGVPGAEDVSYIYLSCRREETFKSLADAAEAQCLFHPSLVLIVVARKSIHP